jgi:NAD(P)-dependent dehydrogenase (short-subunit alcohol dehydrogenase family)
MSWNSRDIPDHTGKVAVVTGANSGLGLESTRELARAGATVVMGARDATRADAARRDILSTVPAAELDIVPLDLASLTSVRTAAASIVAAHPRIDILINNAGVMGIPRRLTQDGFEMQFGTNHLGHFVLTALLLPAIEASGDGRIVTVTSTGRHFAAAFDQSDLAMESSYDPWRAYGRSKRANFLFALELDRRLRAAGAATRSLVAHPGFSNTNLQATSAAESGGGRSQRFFHETVQRFGMDAAGGALPQLRAATDPDADGSELYTPRWVNFGAPVRRRYLPSSAKQDDLDLLWRISEEAAGAPFDVGAIVGGGGT